jgi:hypothetical protein
VICRGLVTLPILEGRAIGLGRYPVQAGRTIGKTRTFCVVVVNTLTEKWIYSEGRYLGGKRYKVRCAPDFRCHGQPVKIAIPDDHPGAVKFIPRIVDDGTIGNH